jgi:hypothetical protein
LSLQYVIFNVLKEYCIPKVKKKKIWGKDKRLVVYEESRVNRAG